MKLRKVWYTGVQVVYDLVLKMNPRKMGAHAVILDEQGRVLMLRGRYADNWGLPGGGLDRREHLDTAVIRECREELGVTVAVDGMTGMYYLTHSSIYVGIFRCRIVQGEIRLSHEHKEFRWTPPDEVQGRLRQMVADAVAGEGGTVLRTFS